MICSQFQFDIIVQQHHRNNLTRDCESKHFSGHIYVRRHLVHSLRTMESGSSKPTRKEEFAVTALNNVF